MAQRRNGNYQIKRHGGSERRGTFPTPREVYVGVQQEQGRGKRLLIEQMRARYESTKDKYSHLNNTDLPIFKHKAEILEVIESTKATVISGATGSGKSTEIGAYLMGAGYEKIFIMVPRRVIANGLYERLRDVYQERGGDEMAKLVGVMHGERVESDEEANKIVILTPQTFVKMESSIRERYKDSKVAIIADEIHEANLHSEIATGIAGFSVQENDSWRLIASSATHDTATLTMPFGKINNLEKVDDKYPAVTMVKIEGRPFPVDIREEAERTAMELYAEIGQDYEKSIIFTSGKKEIDHIIDEIRKELNRRERGSSSDVLFRKLHGELTEVELAQVNDPMPEGKRLVIVSSPAGNSGITIPKTQLVITDGTVNRAELDDDGAPGLVRHQASQAEIIQQMGRAGRDIAGGIGYLTKPVEQHEHGVVNPDQERLGFLAIEARRPHAPAEIYQTQLGRTVLEVAGIKRKFSDINLYLPHSVEFTGITQAEQLLQRIGGLDEEGVITADGIAMDQYALSPELARGLVEARNQSRPQQQLARIALIAAAIETGGLQDFSKKDSTNWTDLISNETNDDYMAQLQLFEQVGFTEYGRDIAWMRQYDLHPKRIIQARKLAAKILHKLRMNPDNISLSPISHEEKIQLFRDFTAGMLDLVHEPVGKNRQHDTLYSNIHSGNNEHATKRTISRRSQLTSEHPYIAGFPRWYLEGPNNRTVKNIVELGFPIDIEVVKEFAARNEILDTKILPSVMSNGRVVEMEQASFGSVIVGSARKRGSLDLVPAESQVVLYESIVANPGKWQRSMLDLAKRLRKYKEQLQEGVFEHYLRKGHPAILKAEDVHTLVQELVKQHRSHAEVEEQIAKHIYSQRVGLGEYFDQTAIDAINEEIPDAIYIWGINMPFKVSYDGKQPYITNLKDSHFSQANGKPIKLKNGVEVLVQIGKEGGRGTIRVSAASLKS